MSTRHLVDPELRATLDNWPAAARTVAALQVRRAALSRVLPAPATYALADVEMERRLVPGPHGAPDVHVILHRPATVSGPLPVYLHMHGGGYVFGCAEMCSPANVRLAAEVQCLVASVDYRLAPDTVAPGSVEDCYAVLRWLHEQADTLGIDRQRIAIGGESAGGGLAAALALLARDRGDYAICFQMLLSPMLDDRSAVDSCDPHVGEFVWTQAENAFGWRCLLGQEPGLDNVRSYAAAARAEDVSKLPPTYLAVGALDLFRDEGVTYAMRLLRAGVPVELHVIPGAYHGFERAASAKIVKAAEQERRSVLSRALAQTSC